MDHIKVVRQLSQRMNTSEEVASQWLEAVHDVESNRFPEIRVAETDKAVCTAVMRPLTLESRNAIQHEELEMHHFPFRIGREGRVSKSKLMKESNNRRSASFCRATNDIYLHDNGIPLNISREHFQIEQANDGSFLLVERGSTCGTIVNGATVGGDHTEAICSLADGDTIVVGTSESPYIFEFRILGTGTLPH